MKPWSPRESSALARLWPRAPHAEILRGRGPAMTARCLRCHRSLTSPAPHGYGPRCARIVGATAAAQRALFGGDAGPGPVLCTGDVWRCQCSRCIRDRAQETAHRRAASEARALDEGAA